MKKNVFAILFPLSCYALFVMPKAFSKDSKRKNHVVMVVDSEFDAGNEVYKDKLLAYFRMRCNGLLAIEGKSSTFLENLPLDIHKKLLIDELKRQIDHKISRCTLAQNEIPKALTIENISELEVKGLGGLSRFLDPKIFENLRSEWNLYKKRGEEYRAAKGSLESWDVYRFVHRIANKFHGLGTTSIISYKNPDVKFVLVEKSLGSLNISFSDCPYSNRGLTRRTELFNDSEIRELIHKIPASEETILRELGKKYQVSIANLSFGVDFRDIINGNDLNINQCEPIEEKIAKSYIKGMNVVDDNSYEKMPFLTLHAAGNSGIKSDTQSDSYLCNPQSQHVLTVGSYDFDANLISGNFGECVQLHVLGSSLTVAGPYGLLLSKSGSSFAAPLLARYITQNFAADESHETIIDGVKRKTVEKLFPPDNTYSIFAFPQQKTRKKEE